MAGEKDFPFLAFLKLFDAKQAVYINISETQKLPEKNRCHHPASILDRPNMPPARANAPQAGASLACTDHVVFGARTNQFSALARNWTTIYFIQQQT